MDGTHNTRVPLKAKGVQGKQRSKQRSPTRTARRIDKRNLWEEEA